jgi:hypothetical protein
VIGNLLLVKGARDTYREVIRTHSSHSADHTQRRLVDYLGALSTQVRNLSRVSEVLDAVQSSNQRKLPPEDLVQKMEEVEDEWRKNDPIYSRVQRELLGNPASVFLREFISVVPTFREILVTDSQGRLVAATKKTSDYFQGDEQWWQSAYQEGHGKRFISDIHFDESANINGISIAEPIKEPPSDEAIGIVKVIVGVDEITAFVDSVKLGGGTHAELIRADGKGIVGPLRVLHYQFPEGFQLTALSHLAVEATEVRTLPEEKRPVLLGLPRFRFRDHVDELDWYVVINTPSDEVSVPLHRINTWLLYAVLVSAIIVAGLAFIFSRFASKRAV